MIPLRSVIEKELSHIISDIATYALDREAIIDRVIDLRKVLRENKLTASTQEEH